MVVDDNAVIRDILKLSLEHYKHRVTQACDGKEAIELMLAQPPDLILLDIMMPNMNGFEVLEFMSTDPELSNIPVIVISSDDQIDSTVRCIQLGAEDYLVKPPNQILLQTRVNSCLRKKFSRDKEKAHQAAMQQMYEAVKVANSAKTEFMVMAAQELRNPVAQIASTNVLFNRVGNLNSTQELLLEKINFSLESIQGLIADLDVVSRLDTDNTNFHLESLNLAELVQDVVNSLSDDLNLRGHKVEVNIPEELPTILADRESMNQVLTNLFGNAIKYTPDCGEIAATAVYEPKHQFVYITIQDTGLGIKPEEQKQIFSKFFRSSNSQVRVRPGTGLGLYITKSLVEKQNGRIWFQSKYGEGTEFHFTLPISTEQVEAEPVREMALMPE